MHEASLMHALLEKALAVMDEAGAHRIVQLEVEVGALCQIVPEVWETAFAAAAPGTPFEHARMVWRVVPASVACPACAAEYSPSDVFWSCPACGAYGGEVLSGDDITLMRVEVAVQSLEAQI